MNAAMMAPDDEAGLAAAIIEAQAGGQAVQIEGFGSKAGFLRAVAAERTISTRRYQGVTLYAPKELVVSARAGTPLAEIEAMLAEAGQHLSAEPPHYAFLRDAGAAAQSLGGVVACNLSGPRRIAWGALRDHVLGVRAITGRGEMIRSGGRVLKNVTGLDLAKLLTGSYGTLALLSEITLKTLPIPEDTGTLLLRGQAAREAVAALSRALGSPFSVTGAAYLPAAAAGSLGYDQAVTVIRIEDVAASVRYRLGALAAILAGVGAMEMLDRAASLPLWAAIRDAVPLVVGAEAMVWRVSVAPSQGPVILARAQALGLDGYLDWGGGLLMLAGPASDAAMRGLTEAVRAVGGGWWLLRAPEPMRVRWDCVPEENPALALIRKRVQERFDPAGVFAPGKLYAA